ncbi:MAG: redoxin domain-containing protein [Bacteroidia bacterium]|nr:redoxin domain-containing protein [Bacteroidia bacterium]
MLKQGDKAPNFTLVNTDKQEVTLTQYEGKNVVLLFFPMAFTGVCTAELCTVRDNITNYNQMNAEVLAISVDSPFALGAFKDKEHYNFQLLSDFNKTVSTAYSSLYETFAFGMAGVSKRSAFVIDKTGTIQYAEVLENAGEVPNLAKIKELLATLN